MHIGLLHIPHHFCQYKTNCGINLMCPLQIHWTFVWRLYFQVVYINLPKGPCTVKMTCRYRFMLWCGTVQLWPVIYYLCNLNAINYCQSASYCVIVATLYRVLSKSTPFHSGQTLPVQWKSSVYSSVNGAHTLSLCDRGPGLWIIEQVSAVESCVCKSRLQKQGD